MEDKMIINRILMQFEQLLRTVNREQINGKFEKLSIEDLKPIVDVVARARASYLKHLHDLCKKYEGTDKLPSTEELCELSELRSRFSDLADGAKSLKISIERGYMDVKVK